jgi:PBP1b-binding outer membrane lipoprotein LpoB
MKKNPIGLYFIAITMMTVIILMISGCSSSSSPATNTENSDNDNVLLPNATIDNEISCYEKYDKANVYFTARASR